MAALLVLTTSPADSDCVGRRIGIFPGGSTPTMFAADSPFWIGYGFVAAPNELAGGDPGFLSDDTRFELDVDGEHVPLTTEVVRDGRDARKTSFVSFAEGLPAGWHEFVGRWYDSGALILSSRNTIEFVGS